MRILIIGGTGFIGPFVARQLHAQGHELLLLHRGSSDADLPPGVAHLHGDWSRLPDHRDAITRFAPEVAVAMYAMTEQQAELILAACRGLVRRAVAISSMDVYRAYDRFRGADPGPPDPAPLTEDSPLRDKLYPYRGTVPLNAATAPWMDDYDKIMVERAFMRDPAIAGTVLRLPMVHGPGDGQHRFFPTVKRMTDGRPAILLGEDWAAFHVARAYVENVAAAIALAATDDRAAGRTYNLGDPDSPTEAEWTAALAQVAGWQGQIITLPPDQLPPHLQTTANTAQHFHADSGRIRRELGYTEPIGRDEALRRTIAWERTHQPATIDPAHYDYAAEDRALAAR